MDVGELNQVAEAMVPKIQRVVAEENEKQLTKIMKRIDDHEMKDNATFANHENRIADLEKTRWKVAATWGFIVGAVTFAYHYGKDLIKKFHG